MARRGFNVGRTPSKRLPRGPGLSETDRARFGRGRKAVRSSGSGALDVRRRNDAARARSDGVGESPPDESRRKDSRARIDGDARPVVAARRSRGAPSATRRARGDGDGAGDGSSSSSITGRNAPPPRRPAPKRSPTNEILAAPRRRRNARRLVHRAQGEYKQTELRNTSASARGAGRAAIRSRSAAVVPHRDEPQRSKGSHRDGQPSCGTPSKPPSGRRRRSDVVRSLSMGMSSRPSALAAEASTSRAKTRRGGPRQTREGEPPPPPPSTPCKGARATFEEGSHHLRGGRDHLRVLRREGGTRQVPPKVVG